MSFNDTVPRQVKDLEKQIKHNLYEIDELNEGMHDCDCEYCDRGNDLTWEQIEEKEEELKQVNKLLEKTLALLKLYANEHKIELT